MSKFVKSLLKDPRFQCPNSMKISNSDWETKLEELIENPEKYQNSVMSEMLAKIQQENRDRFIAFSANGIPMYIHPESHSHRPDLNVEVISKIVLPEDNTFYRNTIDLGRIIGKDHLVETDEHDTIVYLQRGNRPGRSRMVLKEADDTSFATIIACVAKEEDGTPAELVGKWILVTLFEGKPGEREPFDRAFTNADIDEGVAAAKEKAEAFWATHALVPTEEELEQIEIDDVSIALAICDMLIDEMDLGFHEHTQVYFASRGDILDSWKIMGHYPDGSCKLDPVNTVDEIRETIEWHIDGYARNPDGYDY